MKNEQKAARGRADEAANLLWWRASTERTIARRGLLQSRWISFATLERAWGAVVALVAEETEPWPDAFAVVAAAEADGVALAWADDPGERASGPRPYIRPALEALAVRVETSRAQGQLDALLAEPPDPPLPAPPRTTARARAQYREHAAATKRTDVALMRDHVRRERAQDAIADAIVRWQSVWLSNWPLRVAAVAGERERALDLAQGVRAAGLAGLRGALDPLRPRARMLAPTRSPRKAKATRAPGKKRARAKATRTRTARSRAR